MKWYKIYEPVHWYTVRVYVCSPVQFQRVADKMDLDFDYKTNAAKALSFMRENKAVMWLSEYNYWILVHECASHIYPYLAKYFNYDTSYMGEFIWYHSQYLVDTIETSLHKSALRCKKIGMGKKKGGEKC